LAEIKQGVRVARVLGGSPLQEAQIALGFPGAQGRIEIARMLNDNVRRAKLGAETTQRGQNLLVNSMLPARLGMVAKKPYMLGNGGGSRGGVGHALALDELGRVFL